MTSSGKRASPRWFAPLPWRLLWIPAGFMLAFDAHRIARGWRWDAIDVVFHAGTALYFAAIAASTLRPEIEICGDRLIFRTRDFGRRRSVSLGEVDELEVQPAHGDRVRLRTKGGERVELRLRRTSDEDRERIVAELRARTHAPVHVRL